MGNDIKRGKDTTTQKRHSLNREQKNRRERERERERPALFLCSFVDHRIEVFPLLVGVSSLRLSLSAPVKRRWIVRLGEEGGDRERSARYHYYYTNQRAHLCSVCDSCVSYCDGLIISGFHGTRTEVIYGSLYGRSEGVK